MIPKHDLFSLTMQQLLEKYAHAADWLSNYEFTVQPENSMSAVISAQPESYFTDMDVSPDEFSDRFYEYLCDMEFLLTHKREDIQSISLLPGFDKLGNKEKFEKITIRKGEIVGIVGPTGSGKSQLLADIEWGASEDTPTRRKVLINDRPVEHSFEIGTSKKIVAQLSQNMNFVVDLSVRDFLDMHADCWLVEDKEAIVEKTLSVANQLVGEKFLADTHVTNLSGGQSRALMIADCAYLSAAPIVLIDEIENAGINRQQALNILSGADKIVLIATHDPILALIADYRLIIKNGGIEKTIFKNADEAAVLEKAQSMSAYLFTLREKLRHGQVLTEDK